MVALGGRLAFGDSLPNAFGGASLGMLAGAGKEGWTKVLRGTASYRFVPTLH